MAPQTHSTAAPEDRYLFSPCRTPTRLLLPCLKERTRSGSRASSIRYETILFGSPARVREQKAELLEVSGCNDVICAFAWGPFPHAQTLRLLRLFAEEVMPAFADSTALLA